LGANLNFGADDAAPVDNTLDDNLGQLNHELSELLIFLAQRL
jgi:hypothetical protein